MRSSAHRMRSLLARHREACSHSRAVFPSGRSTSSRLSRSAEPKPGAEIARNSSAPSCARRAASRCVRLLAGEAPHHAIDHLDRALRTERREHLGAPQNTERLLERRLKLVRQNARSPRWRPAPDSEPAPPSPGAQAAAIPHAPELHRLHREPREQRLELPFPSRPEDDRGYPNTSPNNFRRSLCV